MTSGCSASTIFRNISGCFSISARKPATFQEMALNVFVPPGMGCLGAGSCGMISGSSTFVFLVFFFKGVSDVATSPSSPASVVGGSAFFFFGGMPATREAR